MMLQTLNVQESQWFSSYFDIPGM